MLVPCEVETLFITNMILMSSTSLRIKYQTKLCGVYCKKEFNGTRVCRAPYYPSLTISPPGSPFIKVHVPTLNPLIQLYSDLVISDVSASNQGIIPPSQNKPAISGHAEDNHIIMRLPINKGSAGCGSWWSGGYIKMEERIQHSVL